MAASLPARVLMIGLWTEADDQGVFEWKPLTLKARILPVDAVDLVALLQELEDAKVIRRFEHDGKPFGAIRNFRKFQRPQKPTPKYTLPETLRSFVGLSDSPIVALPEPDGSDEGKSPQMEDGGCRVEEKPTLVETFISKTDEEKLERRDQAAPSVANLPTEPSEIYDDAALKGFAFEFDGMDVLEAIRELAHWTNRKGTTDPIERKNMIYGGLQKRHGRFKLQSSLKAPEAAQVSRQLATSRLAQRRTA